MEVYIQSTKHLERRFMVFRTVNRDNTVDKIIELENSEISGEMISEINKFINELNEADIKLYILGSLVNGRGRLKSKLGETNEIKEFYTLVENKGIEVYNFKNMISLRDELVKSIVAYSKAKRKPTIILNGKEYKIFNNDYKGKYNQVNLYLRGIANSADEDKVGFSVAVLNKGIYNKELYFKEKPTTSNRMLLIACIEAVKSLREPCAINLYTHTNLGFSGGNVNADLKQELFTLLREGNHCVNEYVSRHNQEYLDKLIETKFKKA